MTDALTALAVQYEREQRRQAEQYEAFEKQMKRLATQVEDLQQQLSELERQVELLALDYRETATVLSGE